ncbi:MAG: hypothetical protein WCK35_00840 [Chloroflexota bacterium]
MKKTSVFLLLLMYLTACQSQPAIIATLPVSSPLPVSAAPTATCTATPTAPILVPEPTATEDPRIALSVLQNASFHSSNWGDYQLVNGIFYRTPASPGETAELYSTQLSLSSTGDLNADGLPDAAVILVTYNGGNGNNKELAVLLNQAGGLTNIATVDVGFMVAVEALEIQSGVILLNVRVAGPNDALCCPSQQETWQFQLDGNQLKRKP